MCLMGCLPEASRNLLVPCVAESSFGKGDLLLPEGQVAQHISIIKIGAVMASRQGDDGHAHPVALLGRGKTLGEYAIYGHSEQISAVALSAGRVCRLEVPELYRLGVVDRKFHTCVQVRIVRSLGQLADWSRVMRIKGLRLTATTIGAVVTDCTLSKAELHRLSLSAHDGLARAARHAPRRRLRGGRDPTARRGEVNG